MATHPRNALNRIARLSTVMLVVCALPALASVPCDLGHACWGAASNAADLQQRLAERAAKIEYAAMMHTDRTSYRSAMVRSEYRAFGGVGTIVCLVDGESSTSTAFLVGRFDVAVTVADTFLREDGRWTSAGSCTYVSSNPAGEVRERIPLAAFTTQWQAQPNTAGQPAADLAVVRLSAPVRTALRTLSFAKFSHTHAPVALIGFRRDLSIDVVIRKALGTVYQRNTRSCVLFSHDVDSRRISPGAPVIDVRDGVVIGIHTQLRKRSGCRPAGNAMIVMTPWLENTLRAEIAAPTQAAQSP